MFASRVVIAALALLCSLVAHAEPMAGSTRLAPGDQKVLTFPAPVTKIATSNPEVARLTVSGNQEVVLTAMAEGTSELTIWLRNREVPLRSSVAVATTLGGSLPFGTQVQTDIRVLEVSRSELNSLGVYYANLFNGGESAVGIAPPGSGFRGFPGAGGAQAPIGGDGFNLFGIGSNSLTIINALESGGFAYTLAEPSLTSLSGQSASFLSGGEFPVPTRNDNNGVQVEFKEFGVGLSLTPTVISGDQIILKVAPEVSELDFSAGVETGGVAVPGLRVRRAETTVSLAPGETFIISGLVSRSTINSSDRVPGLGNLPVLGAFFRSSRISRDDKELVMVVTPHLVTPRKAGRPPVTLPGGAYHESSTGWLDMATEPRRGSQPIRHGVSW
ncbi:type II and III secretion system protein family protein [Alloalcanivorax gelatiniphagus]|uniref:Secretin n=1 Tax=Alloalcanivorax gelatiniphagus TaxID=1194167 RepID=A0ABY2XH12_9GAMM|nr:pilus assembly protein N-terminal domain-containing protein [Alloalcanivorax gelatiniphagus]TMW10948.1 secretin [Alloalcanivorax gelatiniphagus]|tara:strand:+ start:30676 stop:31836 length:1161 start_codon:yes stop_codon:yes gene_type:complete